jgi:PPM family protein phosphatase
MHKTISAIVSETNKSENKDNMGEFTIDASNYVFVTDGLNPFDSSLNSSTDVINSFHKSISRLSPDDINFLHSYMEKLYKKSKPNLLKFNNKNNEEKILGNTAILVSENEDRIIIVHSGNGAIWHIKGNFNYLTDDLLFPWNTINLLNPFLLSEKVKKFSNKQDLRCQDNKKSTPCIIELQKDKQHGDIILICTDGIYSTEQVKGGTEKGIWASKNKIYMFKIFSCLNHFFRSEKLQDKNNLEHLLKLYLKELKPFLTDDATIGVLITSAALEYQKKMNQVEF